MSNLKLLVVDDSPTFRAILLSVLQKFPEVEEVQEAVDGIDALNILEDYTPDLVLLDIEMPRLSGLPTLRIARRRYPHIDILIVSGASRGAAELTVQAIDGGAIDFIVKPKGTNPQHNNDALYKRLSPFIRFIAARPERTLKKRRKKSLDWTESLTDSTAGIHVSKVEEALKEYGKITDSATNNVRTSAQVDSEPGIQSHGETPLEAERNRLLLEGEERNRLLLEEEEARKHTNALKKLKKRKSGIRLIVIGASTGSPGALASMIPIFPANFPVPIILIVHLPDAFSASFASHLAKKSKLKVTLANEDEFLLPSTVYLARADKHLVVKSDSSFGGLLPYRFSYSDAPPVDGLRPSIDMMFDSLAAANTTGCLGVIMTGMGKDGTKGIKKLKELPGNFCMVQSPESCVVGSMPQSLIDNGLVDEVVPLGELGSAIISLATKK